MLDVEFLLNPSLEKTIIYRHRSGILKSKFVELFQSIAEQNGKLLIRAHGMSMSGSLFPSLYYFDWSEASLLDRKTLAEQAKTIASKQDWIALFIPFDQFDESDLICSAFQDVGLVVDEPIIKHMTLLPSLRYLEYATDLANKPSLTSQPRFIASFDPFLKRPRSDLLDLMLEFDRIVLTRADAVTNILGIENDGDEFVLREWKRLDLSRLRRFLKTKDRWDLVFLVRGLDRSYWTLGDRADEVIAKLYRATTRLITSLETTADINYDDVMLWAAFLLAWTDRLDCQLKQSSEGTERNRDLFVVKLDQMARDFGDRAVHSAAINVLGSVGIRDSSGLAFVVQALDGTFCFDGRPMGEDGTALFGEAGRSWPQREGQ